MQKTLSQLPESVQNDLRNRRLNLHKEWKKNDPYHILFTNKQGTRYFKADRVTESWNDDKGHYMPYGGGSHWRISYGIIQWDWAHDNTLMEEKYFWVCSKKRFGVSSNKTIIPSALKTKAEVIALAKAIGTLEM